MAESVDRLIEQLRDFRTRAGARARLLSAGSAAVEPLIGALRDHSEGVRWAAASTLGQLRDERAIDPLIEALDDATAAAVASEALAAITGEEFGQNPQHWRAWRKGETIEPAAAPTHKRLLTDAELVRQALEGLAREVQQAGEVFVARIPRGDQRYQTVNINPSDKDRDGNAVVTIDTICGPASKGHHEWALRQNLELPFGAIALRNVADIPHFVIVHRLIRQTADPLAVREAVENIARWGDAIEKALCEQDTR